MAARQRVVDPSVLGHWQVLASLPELADTPELAKLTGIARLTARGQRNAAERYEAMRDLVGDPAGSPFADYFRHELGAVRFGRQRAPALRLPAGR